MRVPFLDLAPAYEELRPAIDAAILGTALSGRYVLGPEVEAFESEFAAFCGVAHAVGVGNGLDALHLILRAWGIGEGDEVIVPANTFIGTWLAVTMCGAKPVPVEPDPFTYNLDPARLEEVVTRRTKAIIAVHLYGQPADMKAITEFGQAYRIRVLEDAAQAHGARSCGKRTGSLGDAAAWSFYPSKNLGCLGDGGAVTTDDPYLASQVRKLSNYGAATKYVHEMPDGVNSRLDEVQAAILRVRLRHLDEWNARRARVAASYAAGLQDSGYTCPTVADGADPVWHLFVVRTRNRPSVVAALGALGIETSVHYPTPPHRQKAYAHLGFGPGILPLTELLSEEVMSLPIGPHLPDESIARVIDAALSAGR